MEPNLLKSRTPLHLSAIYFFLTVHFASLHFLPYLKGHQANHQVGVRIKSVQNDDTRHILFQNIISRN